MAALYAQFDRNTGDWVLVVSQPDVVTDENIATLHPNGVVEYADGREDTISIFHPASIIELE